jgi:hypothetical protein
LIHRSQDWSTLFIDSTQGKYGDLQAVTGRSLAAIPALEAPPNPHADAGAHLPEAFTSS